MRRSALWAVAVALLGMCSTAQATTFTFNTDPFAGSTALTTPGRQVVGGEPFINFDIANDLFLFDTLAFGAYGVTGPVNFVNALAPNIPTSGVNVVVLESFDDDNNTGTPFAAGNAANLIANQITTPGAGFFVYFNQGLDLPRLVFSTDLNDPTADLKILARMVNLSGQNGRNAMATFADDNFAIAAPEPSSLTLLGLGIVGLSRRVLRRKQTLA
jgi:PEP-CTERM motif